MRRGELKGAMTWMDKNHGPHAVVDIQKVRAMNEWAKDMEKAFLAASIYLTPPISDDDAEKAYNILMMELANQRPDLEADDE